jgi:hypothetical protein
MKAYVRFIFAGDTKIAIKALSSTEIVLDC